MMVGLAATHLLQRVRASYDGRMVLMKGLEVGAHYPDSSLRPFRDLDLLVDDAEQAQQALIAGGFEPTGDERMYLNIHHLRPLRWPGLPLVVELHDRPKWLDWQAPPPTSDLLDAAVPSRTGVGRSRGTAARRITRSSSRCTRGRTNRCPGSAICSTWRPLSQSADRASIDSLAAAWGVERVWRATAAAADALFEHGHVPLLVRTWAAPPAVGARADRPGIASRALAVPVLEPAPDDRRSQLRSPPFAQISCRRRARTGG